mmetsp:Transcript_36507/g.91355  ORF Transcript_36507/g.91355 Transcript_36507/m.91355 type:complete len:261 (-) Transcript_36507:295-1077(-)
MPTRRPTRHPRAPWRRHAPRAPRWWPREGSHSRRRAPPAHHQPAVTASPTSCPSHTHRRPLTLRLTSSPGPAMTTSRPRPRRRHRHSTTTPTVRATATHSRKQAAAGAVACGCPRRRKQGARSSGVGLRAAMARRVATPLPPRWKASPSPTPARPTRPLPARPRWWCLPFPTSPTPPATIPTLSTLRASTPRWPTACSSPHTTHTWPPPPRSAAPWTCARPTGWPGRGCARSTPRPCRPSMRPTSGTLAVAWRGCAAWRH